MNTDLEVTRPRVLIVEDEFLVADAVDKALQAAGWDVAGPAMDIEHAVKIAQSESLAAAVLDLNVEGRLVWPVAAILRSRSIPFLFLTGYDQSQMAHPDYRDAPTLGKPFALRDLVSQLARLIDGREAGPAAGDSSPTVEGE